MAGARPRPHLDVGHGRPVRRRPGSLLRGASLECGQRRVRDGRRRPCERVRVGDADPELVLAAPHALDLEPASPVDRPGFLLAVPDPVRPADGQFAYAVIPGAVRQRVGPDQSGPVLAGGVEQLTAWQSLLLVPAGLVAGLIGSVGSVTASGPEPLRPVLAVAGLGLAANLAVRAYR